MDWDLVLVDPGDIVDRAVGKGSVGEQEDGVGSERQRLLHGEAGIGAAVGIDQAQERPQLVLRLLVGRARDRAAGHRDRFVIVEDHLESLRLAQAKHAAPQLDGGARHAIVVDHASGAVDDIDEKLAARANAEKRGLCARVVFRSSQPRRRGRNGRRANRRAPEGTGFWASSISARVRI